MTASLRFLYDHPLPILCGLVVALALCDLVVQHVRWMK